MDENGIPIIGAGLDYSTVKLNRLLCSVLIVLKFKNANLR